MLLISDALIAKYAHDADIYERASLGLPVSEAESLEDGTGDNALAVLFGWIVPTLGAGIGWIPVAMRSRASHASRQRGFDVVTSRSETARPSRP